MPKISSRKPTEKEAFIYMNKNINLYKKNNTTCMTCFRFGDESHIVFHPNTIFYQKGTLFYDSDLCVVTSRLEKGYG